MLELSSGAIIEGRYLRFNYVRSRGPGGQNVNKVNTCAQLTFDLAACEALSGAVKRRLRAAAGRRINSEGQLVLRSDQYREQKRNSEECLRRLRRMIEGALTPPKKRRPTRPTRASKERRLADKKRRSQTKQQRRGIDISN